MRTGIKGKELIKYYEGLHDGDLSLIGLQPKLCPANFWTSGYGRLILDDKGNRLEGLANKKKAYKFNTIHTIEDADKALEEDLVLRESMINSLDLTLTQNQFDALVSFCYNIGFTNLKGSTLLKDIKSKANCNEIKKQFNAWVYAKKKKLAGLIKRRESEAELFCSK